MPKDVLFSILTHYMVWLNTFIQFGQNFNLKWEGTTGNFNERRVYESDKIRAYYAKDIISQKLTENVIPSIKD